MLHQISIEILDNKLKFIYNESLKKGVFMGFILPSQSTGSSSNLNVTDPITPTYDPVAELVNLCPSTLISLHDEDMDFTQIMPLPIVFQSWELSSAEKNAYDYALDHGATYLQAMNDVKNFKHSMSESEFIAMWYIPEPNTTLTMKDLVVSKADYDKIVPPNRGPGMYTYYVRVSVNTVYNVGSTLKTIAYDLMFKLNPF